MNYKKFFILSTVVSYGTLATALAAQDNRNSTVKDAILQDPKSISALNAFIRKSYAGQIVFETGLGKIPVSFEVRFQATPIDLNNMRAFKSEPISARLVGKPFQGHLYAMIHKGALHFQLDGIRDGRLMNFLKCSMPWNDNMLRTKLIFSPTLAHEERNKGNENYSWEPNKKTAFVDCKGFFMEPK